MIVKTFTEEQDAIDFAGLEDVDLAILDIKLKEMSGVDVLARLKQDNPDMKAHYVDWLSDRGNGASIPHPGRP